MVTFKEETLLITYVTIKGGYQTFAESIEEGISRICKTDLFVGETATITDTENGNVVYKFNGTKLVPTTPFVMPNLTTKELSSMVFNNTYSLKDTKELIYERISWMNSVTIQNTNEVMSLKDAIKFLSKRENNGRKFSASVVKKGEFYHIFLKF